MWEYDILDDDTIELTKYYGSEGKLVIPDHIDDKKVTRIGYDLFEECNNLKEVIIPEGVIYIRDHAFEDCENLQKIILPESLGTIGSFAFNGCFNLTEITIPSKVIYIGDYAFYDCISLKKIIIPDSVQKIGFNAFFNCESLEEITLSNYMTGIEEETFRGCKSLKEITLPDHISYIDKFAFGDCTSLTSITLPMSCEIADDAFDGCNNLQVHRYKDTKAQLYENLSLLIKVSTDEKLDDIEKLIKEGKYHEAKDFLYQFLKIDIEDDPDVDYYNYDNKLEYLLCLACTDKEIEEPKMNYYRMFFDLGCVHSLLKEYNEAEKCLIEANKYCPVKVEALFKLADLYKEQNKFDEYRDLLDEIHGKIYKIEDLIKYYCYLADYYVHENDYESAMYIIMYALHFSPNSQLIVDKLMDVQNIMHREDIPGVDGIISSLRSNFIELFFTDDIVKVITSLYRCIQSDEGKRFFDPVKDADSLEIIHKMVEFYNKLG